jgi:sugar O-acyltransferase (sialic acid O-acetyltransferase NeuD family)
MNGPTGILLAGAGLFAEDVTDVALDAGFDVLGWIEGLDPARADPHHLPPIVWVEDQAAHGVGAPIAPAIGPVIRRGLVDRLLTEGRVLATIVHPSAVIARSAVLEPGCVVFPNAVIGARTVVGAGTIVNRGALIGHHTRIGAGSTVGPGANVAGAVSIGPWTYVGMGAIVRDRVTIGADATIGAGAVVVGDVAAGVTVVGLPARPMESKRG